MAHWRAYGGNTSQKVRAVQGKTFIIAGSEPHISAPRKDAADIVLMLRRHLDAGIQQRLYEEAGK